MAADLAKRLGDINTSIIYSNTANEIANTLSGHWTGSFMQESANRPKDAAVIHAFTSFEGYIDVKDPRVA